MASFVLSFYPLDVLDGIWDLIESVSEGFLTYSYYVKMPPTKFRERFLKFMISISLSEKFCCQNLTTSIKVINMTRNSSKSNKLRNINTIGCRTRNITI